MKSGRICLCLNLIAAIAAFVSPAFAASGTATAKPQVISYAQALTGTVGGASVLPTTRTIPHWFGSTLKPQNGVVYGYNMVGADPNNCVGSACSLTIEVDITPLIVNIDELTFSRNDVLAAMLASPQFALNDYGSTPFSSAGGLAPADFTPGGVLLQGDAGNLLQLEDATMRAQFNKTGGSNYHLILHPNVLPAVTINVPNNQGVLAYFTLGTGVIWAGIDPSWWNSQITNLETQSDPTHLAIFLTDNVMLFSLKSPCCLIGFHETNASETSNGNAKVGTYV